MDDEQGDHLRDMENVKLHDFIKEKQLKYIHTQFLVGSGEGHLKEHETQLETLLPLHSMMF